MKRKIMALGLCAVMVLANGTSVFAADNAVSPRMEVCWSCERGRIFETVIRSDYGTCEFVKCSHGHLFEQDHLHVWETTILAECNSCHVRSWYNGTEDEVICEYGLLGGKCPKKR